MKTVFSSTGEIVHLWANKTQPEASTRRVNRMDGGYGAQMFFEGDRLYSYGRHYLIGRHLPDGHVAINAEGSSNTTNNHVREAAYAVRHLKVLRVFNPERDGGNRQVTANVIDVLLRSASTRVKAELRDRDLNAARKIQDDFNEFVRLTAPNEPPLAVFTTSPEHLAALKAEERAEMKAEHARQKERERIKAMTDAEKIEAWRAGQTNQTPYGCGTLLRVNEATGCIDTSRSAHIPIEDAKRLWPAILEVKAGGVDMTFERPLGLYELRLIRADGSIVVGCHDIPASEVRAIAVQLGLAEPA